MSGFAQERRARGYVLITSLIFLLVLTMVAVIAAKNTTLDLRMSKNFSTRAKAFEASEGGRLAINELVDAHVFNRGWPVAMNGTISNSKFGMSAVPVDGNGNPLVTVADNDGDSNPDNLYASNDAGEDVLDPSTLNNDLTYGYDANGDGDTSDPLDIRTNISVFRLGAASSPGSGAAMVAGYEGTAKGAAGGGSAIYYQLRSLSANGALNGARAVTGADYRHVVRN